MSSIHSTSIFKFLSYLLVFCALILHGAQAARIPSRRYTTTITAPSGYRFSWGIDNERLSYGTSTGLYLSRTALKGSNVGQSQINSCASLCETTMKCGFFHPVEMKGSSDGNVMCALYSSKVGKANATFSSGSGTTPGKVTFSYGFTRDAGSVSQVPQSSGSGTKTAGGASSGFSTSTRSTSTTSSTRSSSTTSSTAARTTSSSTSSRSSTTSTKPTSTSSKTTSSSSTTSTVATSTSTFVSPSGYSSSWEINSRRLSYGASTGAYLSRTTLSGEVLGQDQIDECSQNCESSKGCAFFHPILFNNSSDGNVVCSLYNATVTKDKATFSSGTGSTPGTVVKSYAYKRNDGPVITVATPTSSFAYPPSPTGATFVNHQPCEGTRARVPMFVNKAWSNGSVSLASKAFIITHGAGRDFDQAWRDTYPLIGDNDVLVAPVFYLQSDTPTYSNTTGRQSNWFTVNSTLAWSSTIETAGGSDAIYPVSGQFSAIGASCSTFTVYDSLISLFGDKSKYPLLQQVNVIGHSNGAGTSARYSIVAPPPPSGVSLRFSFANTPTFPFFTNDRPWAYTSDQTATISSWMYGFDSNLSPYVARRMSDLPTMFSNWAAQDVRTITGDLDTFSRYNFGDASPPAMVQGGDRRDRNYAFWAYRNLLAGTSTDVSAYYGYGNLTTLNGGVQSLNVPTFNHQNCVVDGVGHVGSQMWASDCGRAALFDSTLPAGSPPLRP